MLLGLAVLPSTRSAGCIECSSVHIPQESSAGHCSPGLLPLLCPTSTAHQGHPAQPSTLALCVTTCWRMNHAAISSAGTLSSPWFYPDAIQPSVSLFLSHETTWTEVPSLFFLLLQQYCTQVCLHVHTCWSRHPACTWAPDGCSPLSLPVLCWTVAPQEGSEAKLF